MKFFAFTAGLVALIVTTALMAVETPTKVLVPEDSTSCLLDANDTMKHIAGQPITAAGTFVGGDSCYDAWSSGVNFSNAWEAIRLGKVDKDCNKKTKLHTTLALDPGRKGFLQTFTTPGDATANPCIHNGVIYRKYNANRDE